jgi:hypothetical protein
MNQYLAKLPPLRFAPNPLLASSSQLKNRNNKLNK